MFASTSCESSPKRIQVVKNIDVRFSVIFGVVNVFLLHKRSGGNMLQCCQTAAQLKQTVFKRGAVPRCPCFAQIHSGIQWLTRRKVWKEFPGVGTSVVLVKPSVVRFGRVCGDWGLSSETVLFFTYWVYWKSSDRPDISGITSCRRLCQRD